jgi:hypothetical protein
MMLTRRCYRRHELEKMLKHPEEMLQHVSDRTDHAQAMLDVEAMKKQPPTSG